MVKETRIVFEIKDIQAFKVRCKKCSNEISLSIESDCGIPDECPMCKKSQWLVGSGAGRLLNVLRYILSEDPNVGSSVHLEIAGEPE